MPESCGAHPYRAVTVAWRAGKPLAVGPDQSANDREATPHARGWSVAHLARANLEPDPVAAPRGVVSQTV
jgi:hypothetical protein